MATIAFLAHSGRDDTTKLARETAAWLSGKGHTARVFTVGPGRQVEEPGEIDPSGWDLAGVDLMVSLGGDGTFLRVVAAAAPIGLPVLGVHFGRLGHLLEVLPEELVPALDRFLDGAFEVAQRAMLEVTVSGEVVPRPGGPAQVHTAAFHAPDVGAPEHATDVLGPAGQGSGGHGPTWLALNELVVEKTGSGHTVQLAVFLDGQLLARWRADGVLVATPTGSTAYNVSAGGPLLAPQLDAMVVTPVAPHLAIDRSVVLESARRVVITVEDDRSAALVVDGRAIGVCAPGTEIHCRISPTRARLVTLGRRNMSRNLASVLAPGPIR